MNADNVAGAKAASASSGASDTIAGDSADLTLVDNLSRILQQGPLPGELEDFSDEDTRAAAAFIAQCASRRPPGKALVRVESFGTQLGRRRMRICIANDDMPFLVDSVAGAIAARGLIIHRLLHPVVCVRRDSDGCLTEIEPLCEDRERRESIMYIEVDRADARTRSELLHELQHVLEAVRASVTDWKAMQQRMREDADRTEDE